MIKITDDMLQNSNSLSWSRKEEYIEGGFYPSFESKGPDWCYTIYPLVRPKNPEPISFYFGGWAKKPNDANRLWIEGKAKTVGECTSICGAHIRHVHGI
jgi:hypothetical protein